jgi:Zn-dependent protease
MLELILSLCLLSGTWASLKGGWHGPRGFQVAGFDINALGLGVLAIGAAMYFWGVLYGIALMVAVIVHEFGHVAAFRVCGHSDARFRLIPLMGGVAISNQLPASADKDFFITLMGPAIGLGPMVFCYAASAALVEIQAEWAFHASNYLYIQAAIFGSLNFFNLLPLWPLDGGKMTLRLVHTFAPSMTRTVAMGMIVLAVALCLLTRSYFMLFFVLSSWQGLMQSEQILHVQTRMSKRRGLLALACYLVTAAALFMGGFTVIGRFF